MSLPIPILAVVPLLLAVLYVSVRLWIPQRTLYGRRPIDRHLLNALTGVPRLTSPLPPVRAAGLRSSRRRVL